MKTRVGLVFIPIICALYITFCNADFPNFECTANRYGEFTPDDESNCHYYFCTARRNWSHRKCEGGGSVPRSFVKRFKNNSTRVNPCRTYDKNCKQTAAALKEVTKRPSYTPRPIECKEVQQRGCRSEGECCDGLQGTSLLCKESICCVPERGPCVEDEDCCKGGKLKCTEGRCIAINCPYPMPSPNCGITSRSANNDNGRFKVGERVYFNSDPCYSLDTSDGSGEFVECMPDGTINPKIPRCKEIVCDEVEAPDNGERDPSQGPDVCGSSVGFDCDNGYELKGAEEIQCTEDGWTNIPPVCTDEAEEEECADLHEQCHRGENAGNGALPCCETNNLKCSRASTCCVEKQGGCSNDTDCCIGLICTTRKKCEPPISFVCKEPVDIVFAVDTSCSIIPNNKETMRTFMAEMARAVELTTDPNRGFQIGALTFNSETTPVTYLNDASNPEKVITTIEHMELNLANDKLCSTHTFDALKMIETEFFTAEKGDRPNVKNTVVLVSDGATKPDHKKNDTLKNSDDLRKKAEILIVGLPQKCKKNKPNCAPKFVGFDEFIHIVGGYPGLPNVYSFKFLELRLALEAIGKALCGPDGVKTNQ
ncbi:unnamed protein product [Owenia fusiformis]|uniref:Uncharacterized protein n=1 Tax=Owenia fusiformis TaxID=6347 RepID=A0A8S4N2W3_OWEFU|nr:unnamed protein product [Owenia fusiformis]